MTDQEVCVDAWCVLPAGHPPVHEVLPIPLQVHAASWWVRGAFLSVLAPTVRAETEEVPC